MNKYRVIDRNGVVVDVEADHLEGDASCVVLYVSHDDRADEQVAVFNGYVSCCKVAE